MTDITPQNPPHTLSPADTPAFFNFGALLEGHVSSRHTVRAYYRWIDSFLVAHTALKPSKAEARRQRMEALPLQLLLPLMAPQVLRAWLGRLSRDEHGKQGLGQARAAVVTLADLLAESGWIPFETAAGIARVRPPRAEEGQRPGRWLSPRQLKLLMVAAERAATSENQALRNSVVLSILCTMALRREELASARWNDFTVANDRMVLRVHGKGKKSAVIDVPRAVARQITRWQQRVGASKYGYQPESPLVRRLWKGGAISRQALSADGIWNIVRDSALLADVGNVAPHDLRRSVAGALHESGVPIDKISQLLRHSNVAVTERYLSRLPKINEGALHMSDMLGLDDDETDEFD